MRKSNRAMQLRSLVELSIIPCLYLCFCIKKNIGRNSQPEYVWLRLPSPAPSIEERFERRCPQEEVSPCASFRSLLPASPLKPGRPR